MIKIFGCSAKMDERKKSGRGTRVDEEHESELFAEEEKQKQKSDEAHAEK